MRKNEYFGRKRFNKILLYDEQVESEIYGLRLIYKLQE